MTANRLGPWTATAMVVSQVVGVGIFLAPATMLRTIGAGRAAVVWIAMGALSMAGALVYAELATRFPRAGGAYVYLREAFGRRCAFVYGWMLLLVVDPGITAALGIGLAEYLLATLGGPPAAAPVVAAGSIAAAGLLTLAGFAVNTRLIQWTAAAKLAIVAVLAGVALTRLGAGAAAAPGQGAITAGGLAGAIVAAFFAFGGWWELGRMGEEVDTPRRTMPVALTGGLAIVTAMYVLVTAAYVLGGPGRVDDSDQAFVLAVGRSLFGPTAGRLLPALVVVAVAGSLAAVLLGSPRVYLAMARDRVLPPVFGRADAARGTLPVSTLIQVALACLLALSGSFAGILGYFVPCAVFFLGLAATSILVLPRPAPGPQVFRVPAHPLPVAVFLILVVAVLGLTAAGQPRQTLVGALVMALGVPVSWLVVPRDATGASSRAR